MQFEWDANKAESNAKKHGVLFEDAIHVFADPDQLSVQDRHENGEERWQTMGLIGGCVVILVAHTVTDRKGTETIRIISARKATKHEVKRYEENKY